MKPSLYTLFVVLSLSLFLWMKPVVTDAHVASRKESGAASVPKQCRAGKTSTEATGWRWSPRSLVRVYYRKGDFSKAERDSLSQAVNSWNDALLETDAHVRFIIGGERESLVEENASITILRGIPKGKDRVGQILLYSLSNGALYASVTISPDIKDSDALVSLMSHEIGHSLGLADCYKCERGTTTMAAFRSDSKGNDVYAPSECDKFTVAAGYSRDASSPTSAQASIERR
jgi:hypothetical protein